MVSIVIPVYKVEEHLRSCLNSVKCQTFKDYEVILVDDGSPDNSGQICDEFAKENSRWSVIHKENEGLSCARNTGIDRAKGEYICFIDSDDTVDENYLQFLYQAIVDNQADLAICGYQRVVQLDHIHNEKQWTQSILEREQIWEEIFENLNNAAWNKIYRRDLIDNIRFPVGLYHGEDLMFNLRYILKCNQAVMINAPLYHYWERKGSITKSGFSERRSMEITSKDLAKKFICDYYPRLKPVAEKYCFQARMNVIRSIYKSDLEAQYSEVVDEYSQYVKMEYKNLYKRLTKKECVEYWLFVYMKWLYKKIIKAGA